MIDGVELGRPKGRACGVVLPVEVVVTVAKGGGARARPLPWDARRPCLTSPLPGSAAME